MAVLIPRIESAKIGWKSLAYPARIGLTPAYVGANVWGHGPPEKFVEFDAVKSLLMLFWGP